MTAITKSSLTMKSNNASFYKLGNLVKGENYFYSAITSISNMDHASLTESMSQPCYNIAYLCSTGTVLCYN